MKYHDLIIDLLTISTDNIWKLYWIELKDTLIQLKCIFIWKDRTDIPERTRTFTARNLTLNMDRPVMIDQFDIWNCICIKWFLLLYEFGCFFLLVEYSKENTLRSTTHYYLQFFVTENTLYYGANICNGNFHRKQHYFLFRFNWIIYILLLSILVKQEDN